MEAVLTILAPVLAAAVSSGAATAVATHLISKAGQRDALRTGVRLLLEERIEAVCLAAIREGSISYGRLRYLRAAHSCYHDGLGGNGNLDALMQAVGQLKLEGDRE